MRQPSRASVDHRGHALAGVAELVGDRGRLARARERVAAERHHRGAHAPTRLKTRCKLVLPPGASKLIAPRYRAEVRAPRASPRQACPNVGPSPGAQRRIGALEPPARLLQPGGLRAARRSTAPTRRAGCSTPPRRVRPGAEPVARGGHADPGEPTPRRGVAGEVRLIGHRTAAGSGRSAPVPAPACRRRRAMESLSASYEAKWLQRLSSAVRLWSAVGGIEPDEPEPVRPVGAAAGEDGAEAPLAGALVDRHADRAAWCRRSTPCRWPAARRGASPVARRGCRAGGRPAPGSCLDPKELERIWRGAMHGFGNRRTRARPFPGPRPPRRRRARRRRAAGRCESHRSRRPPWRRKPACSAPISRPRHWSRGARAETCAVRRSRPPPTPARGSTMRGAGSPQRANGASALSRSAGDSRQSTLGVAAAADAAARRPGAPRRA